MRRWYSGLLVLAVGVALLTWSAGSGQAADPCDTGNVVVCENSLPGSPASEWEITGTGSDTVEGFTTDISVNAGETVDFKVHAESDYTMTIYRMGYYGGAGARRITELTPDQAASRENTPSGCINNSSSTGLVDCGPWRVSASWDVPETAVSGIYFAHVERTSNGDDNHIVFIVRNDDRASDLLFQTSDTTWQAYNSWGGNSLYVGASAGRAHKVSYNRPFNTRATPSGRDFVWGSEYPMVRFLEANGYDVSYLSGIDTDRSGSLLLNHKAFLSVGHDEYWSGAQRANVEAARDAGVNLAFFSANEVYWKTRYERSVDDAQKPYRTLVTYKSTHDDAQTDPSGTWTGTWRDPRFSPPADGGRPENSLTGTITTVIEGTEAITVPAADGKMRFWRGTAVAAQGPGQTATLAARTLGYEWDSDLDNGFRPRGAIRLSSSTYDVAQKLTDYGSQTAPGNATHHLMLYRAGSGALVFGAGTVQWSWGLDSHHDGDGDDPDPNIRQATVNLLADMDAQPVTLQSGLTPASRSTDVEAATATITSPAAGALLTSGTTITVNGTASDVGGLVGGVEVSLDAGKTWHPAQGRENWTYTGVVGQVGETAVQARATDDSGNVQSAPASRQVTVSCPCGMFDGETPQTESSSSTTATELGLRFRPEIDGFVTGVRFWKGSANTGTHTGSLWTTGGSRLAVGTFTDETDSGWQRLTFPQPVQVSGSTDYVVSYFAPQGGYAATRSYFLGVSVDDYPLSAARSTESAPNGVYRAGSSGFPNSTYQGGNYWVAPIFETSRPADTHPPKVTAVQPLDTATSVPLSTTPKVTFDEPLVRDTLTLMLKSDTAMVPGTTSLSDDRMTATFTPTVELTAGTTYTLTSAGGTDDAGNEFTGMTSTFRTAQPSVVGTCPCSLRSDSYVPATRSVADGNQVELGVRFKATQDGYALGVRFYKGPDNTGTHTGTLWTTDGTELAHATFSAESATGWQEVRFDERVPITTGQVYVASYHTSGHYAATPGALNSDLTRGPLIAPATVSSGGNGLYRYGAHAIPNNSGNGTDYGVDLVFEKAPDIIGPQVAAVSPGPGADNVRADSTIRATFSEPVVAGLHATLTRGTEPIGVGIELNGAGQVADLVPETPLEQGVTYTVSVEGGQDEVGNVMEAAYTWSFTTSGVEVCPCRIYPGDHVPQLVDAQDATPLELGVRFTSTANGYVTGIRFYKAAANTGTHVGSLWTTEGALLTSVTFDQESDSGWQQAAFTYPVAVSEGSTYIVSYSAPQGHYSADPRQFVTDWVNGPLTATADRGGASNGIYSTTPGRFPDRTYNATGYAVGPVFIPDTGEDPAPPVLVSTSPEDGASSIPVDQAPMARFNEPLDANTIEAEITGPDATTVTSTVIMGADSSVTVQPAAALEPDAEYTVRIDGADLAGNSLRHPVVWSYRTARAVTTGCPCSLWTDDTAPTVPTSKDSKAVELGVKVVPTEDGLITGIRFFKGSGNTGAHVGTLWSSTGDELARATFTGESTSGWQEVIFSTAVPVTAGQTYVASYHANNGGYSYTGAGFELFGVNRGPLNAPPGTSAQPNGVYAYGNRSFPENGRFTNYWVDVVFEPLT